MFALILTTLSYVLYFNLVVCDDASKGNGTGFVNNTSGLKRDMYVVHAMVYQVGIITNKTDNGTGKFNSTGEEEALTFFHTNGSKVDLSKIPQPLLTNITAEGLVELAPSLPIAQKFKVNSTWTNKIPSKYIRSIDFPEKPDSTEHLNNNKIMFSRNVTYNDNDNTPVKIIKGSAVIPKDVGVQIITIPPLLSLSNNITNIPVPIPNAGVVQYAKINALVHMP